MRKVSNRLQKDWERFLIWILPKRLKQERLIHNTVEKVVESFGPKFTVHEDVVRARLAQCLGCPNQKVLSTFYGCKEHTCKYLGRLGMEIPETVEGYCGRWSKVDSERIKEHKSEIKTIL